MPRRRLIAGREQAIRMPGCFGSRRRSGPGRRSAGRPSRERSNVFASAALASAERQQPAGIRSGRSDDGPAEFEEQAQRGARVEDAARHIAEARCSADGSAKATIVRRPARQPHVCSAFCKRRNVAYRFLGARSGATSHHFGDSAGSTRSPSEARSRPPMAMPKSDGVIQQMLEA